MAQRINVQMIDDIDGTEAESTVTFAFDGKSYEIDLSKTNRDRFKADLTEWIAAARPVRATRARPRAARGQAREIRRWARENDIAVNDKGRIPTETVAAFFRAHS